MFFVMYVSKSKETRVKDRVLNGLKDWKYCFLHSVKFRRLLYVIFILVMIMFRTLLNRDAGINPLSDTIGIWGFYNKEGKFTIQIIENVIMFMPLLFFLFFFLEKTTKKVTKFLSVMGRSVVISLAISLTIEMLQLFLHLGTWQLSDLCFNTLGGLIGGLIYWVSVKLRRVK